MLEMLSVLLLIMVIFVVALLIGKLVHHFMLRDRARRRELAGLAKEMDWDFRHELWASQTYDFSQFSVFSTGTERRAYNTLHGRLMLGKYNCEVRMGDFQYINQSASGGEHSADDALFVNRKKFSYLMVVLPFGDIPKLLIRPEGMFDKLKAKVGLEDINFESIEFSRRFFVNSDSRRFAFDVVSQPMMELLLDSKPPLIDLEGGAVLFTDGQRRWSREEFTLTLNWVRQFFGLWPDHLLDTLDRNNS